MKWLCMGVLLVGSGCIHRDPPARVVIPPRCIVGATADRNVCHSLDANYAECNHVIVKLACVEVKQ